MQRLLEINPPNLHPKNRVQDMSYDHFRILWEIHHNGAFFIQYLGMHLQIFTDHEFIAVFLGRSAFGAEKSSKDRKQDEDDNSQRIGSFYHFFPPIGGVFNFRANNVPICSLEVVQRLFHTIAHLNRSKYSPYQLCDRE